MTAKRFYDFIDILEKYCFSYHNFEDVKDKNGVKYIRFTLSKDKKTADFEALKTALKKRFRNTVDFGSCYYKYAPEIQYNTVIIK